MPRQRAPNPHARDDPRWADLADLVLRVAREIQVRGYTDVRAVSLSPSEGAVMRFLHDQPVASPGEIAEATGQQRTNLSAVLASLEKQGLVERRPSGDDRRRVEVARTARGAANYQLVREEWGAALKAAGQTGGDRLSAALELLDAVERELARTRRGKG